MVFRTWLPTLMTAAMLLGACSSGDGSGHGDPCAGDVLENTTAASSWARELGGIARYHHFAHLDNGEAEVLLLDASGGVLGTLFVRQSYGDSAIADGSMHARLEVEGRQPLELVTRGDALSESGYQVDMRLSEEGRTLDLVAKFEHDACAEPAQQSAAPACAGALPLDQKGVILPSCGLLADEFMRQGRPVTLSALRYEVDAPAKKQPEFGEFLQFGGKNRWSIDLLDRAPGEFKPRPADELASWLQEAGFDQFLDDRRVILLSTAFLDRSWWRAMEQQLAYCAVETDSGPDENNDKNQDAQTQDPQADAGSELDTEAQDLRVREQSLCPGQTNAQDWNSGNDKSSAGLWGDPHLTTLDGDAYDFQGAGEYILVESTGDDPLMIQSRFEPGLSLPDLPACESVTFATAAATVVDGHRIVVERRPSWRVSVDGEVIQGPDELPELADDAFIRVAPGTLEIGWPDGSKMQVKGGDSQGFRIDITLADTRRGQVRGLLGNFNGQADDERMLSDGTVLSMPVSFDDLYKVYGASWLISQEESLFDYEPGKESADYQLADFPAEPARIETLPEDLREDARQRCEKGGVRDPIRLAGCILDTVCSEGDDFVVDAARAPRPRTHASLDENAWLRGAIRQVHSPTDVQPDASQADQCVPPERPVISMLQENTNTELEEALNMQASARGLYAAADDLGASSVSAGTRVRSYQLYRKEGGSLAGPLEASVRFSVPILGLIFDDLEESDAALGDKDSVYHADKFEPILWQDDVFELAEDGHTLNISWGGNSNARIRVITESFGEGN